MPSVIEFSILDFQFGGNNYLYDFPIQHMCCLAYK